MARMQQTARDGGLVEPVAKRSRRFGGFGQKQAAERQSTKTERPVPPSG